MIYIEPKDLWEKFELNKTVLNGHTITCAEDQQTTILMTIEEGSMVLIANDFEVNDSHYEVADSEEEAVEIYSEMLAWLEPEPEDEEEDDDDIEHILAATYAFIGVLTGETPSNLGLTKPDLEDAAYQMSWYLRGRHDIESLIV